MKKAPKSPPLFEKGVERYENAPCLDTGMFGSYILPEVLFGGGRGDIAISLLASTDQEIGFNFMINRGATTIYESLEYFDPSHCHPMFGASAALLFEGLLGIKPQSLKSGYSEVVITPCLDSLVKSAGGKLRTKCGEIGVKFYPENGGTAIEINLPETISATLKIGADVTPLKAGNNKIFIA